MPDPFRARIPTHSSAPRRHDDREDTLLLLASWLATVSVEKTTQSLRSAPASGKLRRVAGSAPAATGPHFGQDS
jgi:hypothetical protein